ncbi:hypothetical protein [Trebonia sp.]|uniref:hypothetical protein n=1 Tax=Trebonia sp. TaxID=2767075 RepID=UPI00262C0A31|nr:hypothetical protein [Trebonia sp.]
MAFSFISITTGIFTTYAALVTEHERQQSYGAFRLAAALRWRTPVWTLTAVHRITGRCGQLAGVDVADLRSGAVRFVPCDLVVFTADWIPEHVLARTAGLAIDPGTAGPAVDAALATSAAGVFAAGNLVHAAETAGVAALSGRHAARHAARFLAGQPAGPAPVPVRVEQPLLWRPPADARPPGPPQRGMAHPGTPGRRPRPGTGCLAPGCPRTGSRPLAGGRGRAAARRGVASCPPR